MTGSLFLVLPALQKESFSFVSFILDKLYELSETLFDSLYCIFQLKSKLCMLICGINASWIEFWMFSFHDLCARDIKRIV